MTSPGRRVAAGAGADAGVSRAGSQLAALRS